MQSFAEIIDEFEPLTVFANRTILDVWQGSEYGTGDVCLFVLPCNS